jgi:hypothetical protein
MKPFSAGHNMKKRAVTFFERLNDSSSELMNKMPHLLAWARDQWLLACGLEKGEDGWTLFRTFAVEMAVRVSDQSLLPLLKRAVDAEDGHNALESVLAYIAGRPPRTWTDADVDRFKVQAKVYGRTFQIERVGAEYEFSLSPKQRKHSLKVADDLRQYVQKSYDEDPQVLKAALQMLMKDLNRRSH